MLHGGDAPNVVPHETSGRWYVRAKNLTRARRARAAGRALLRGGALATGCTVDVEKARAAVQRVRARQGDLAALYRANAERSAGSSSTSPTRSRSGSLGRPTWRTSRSRSRRIHPMLGLDCFPASNHQPEFTAACITPKADQAVVDGAAGDGLDGHRRGDGRGDAVRGCWRECGHERRPDRSRQAQGVLVPALHEARGRDHVWHGPPRRSARALPGAGRRRPAGRRASELADATGLDERWVREWAHNQAAAKLRRLRRATASGSGSTPEAVAVLADAGPPGVRHGHVPPAAPDDGRRSSRCRSRSAPASGYDYDSHGPEARRASSAASSRGTATSSCPSCCRRSTAWSTRAARRRARRSTSAAAPASPCCTMAAGVPDSRRPRLRHLRARPRAGRAPPGRARAGQRRVPRRPRATRCPRDGSVDLVTTFDCIHDMTAPAGDDGGDPRGDRDRRRRGCSSTSRPATRSRRTSRRTRWPR